MVRLIFRERFKRTNGDTGESLYTVDVSCPEIETALANGGSGPDGYQHTELVGVEVRNEKA